MGKLNITLNQMRMVVEALEQKMQHLELEIRQIKEQMEKVNQSLQFARF